MDLRLKICGDTMRVIKDDAAFPLIAKNMENGLVFLNFWGKMKLYVKKLNADGMTYFSI